MSLTRNLKKGVIGLFSIMSFVVPFACKKNKTENYCSNTTIQDKMGIKNIKMMNNAEIKEASITENTKFKSAILSVTIEDFNKKFSLGDSCNVKFSNGYTLYDIPYFDGYYVKNQAPVIVAYPSDTYVLITLNNYGIWDAANLNEDVTVTITLNEKSKYIATEEALGQSYSLYIDDYDSNEEFSNFRSLKGGTLKDNLVYRGASPVDNSRNRAGITDELLKANSINTVIDLADDESNINSYFSDSTFSSDYTKDIYEKGNMVLLSMGSSYESEIYKTSVVKGLRFMIQKTSPYYIHCMEGKDRTGFVCFLIEALMGATYNEMKDDYMLTYKNYYKISEELTKSKYDAVVDLYFNSFAASLYGVEDLETLINASYQESAKQYLKEGGMKNSEIEQLISLLSK